MLAGGLSGLHEGGQAGHGGGGASGLGRTSSGPPVGGLTVRGLAAGQGAGLNLGTTGGGKQPMALARDAIAAALAQGNVAGQVRVPACLMSHCNAAILSSPAD